MKKTNDKIKQMDLSELYVIFKFLNGSYVKLMQSGGVIDENEKEILIERLDVIKEEINRRINNLF